MKRTEYNDKRFAFPFVAYTPKKMKDGLPIIIQLHGAGERGPGKEKLGLVDIHGFSDYIKDKDINCIFIMPQCPEKSFWAAKVESIIRFVKQMIKEFGADKKAVYLTGLSMGGFGTWMTAMARSDLFAAIAPVCGGGMGWNAASIKVPVWAFHGAKDTVVDPFYSEDMVKKLEKAGADVKFTLVENVGHSVWDNAYNGELLEWLLSHRRG